MEGQEIFETESLERFAIPEDHIPGLKSCARIHATKNLIRRVNFPA
jgi:hypothetical protein